MSETLVHTQMIMDAREMSESQSAGRESVLI